MLEGLEISEVSLYDVENSAETIRLDSDYYLKNYINVESLIKSRIQDFVKFSEMGLDVDGSAFYPALEPFYNKGVFPFIRVGDVKEYVDFEGCIKIPEHILPDFPTLKRVKKGDIVLTKGGTIANAGLITQDACVSRDLIFINSSILKEEEYISLFLYFSSDFAYKQLVRSSSQSVQPHLTITLVRNLDIFLLSTNFKIKISELYKSAHSIQETSKTLYQEAENLLLSELGIDESVFKVTKNEVVANVKSFADFENSWRLDAEYYQPKYERLISKIQSQPHQTLGSIVNIVKSIEPGSEAYQSIGIPFVRISNMTKFGLSEPDIHLDNEAFNFPLLMPKKDTILLTKDGTVGTAYKVEKDSYFITSGAILHLTITDKKVLPDFLTLVLNSILTKLQSERDAGGSIIQHWKPSEIQQVIVPVLPIDFQQIIIEKIQESFSLKTKSEQLLSLAKRAVEIAIEEGEDTAVTWVRGHE